jgi:hypothetical protein
VRMNHPPTRNRCPLIGSANVLIAPRTASLVWRRIRIRRIVAINPTRRMHAALAIMAVTIIGCSPASEGGTSVAGATTTAESATTVTTAVEPLVTTTTQGEVAVPQTPVEFTGRIICGPPVSPDRGGDSETVEIGDEGMVLSRYRDGAWRQTATMSDPRLEGAVYHTWESDTYAMPGADDGTGIWAATHRIENEAGAWEGRGYGANFSDGTVVGDEAIGDSVWIGEGAYAGLIAIMESTFFEPCGFDVRGIIFEGAPVPEPYFTR